METKFTITIKTDNMNKIYDTDNPDEFTEEHEITKYVEEQIHNAVKKWLTYNLSEDTLNEVLMNDAIPEFEFLKVDDWDNLEDYGDISITLTEEDDIKETLTHVINKNPTIAIEEIQEPEVIEELPIFEDNDNENR